MNVKAFHWCCVAVALPLLVLAGCGEPPPPPEPEGPPPPTAREIANELGGIVQPLMNQFGQPRQLIPPEREQQALNQLRSVKQKHLTSEKGPEGIREAGEYVQGLITQAFDNEAYAMTLFAFKALEVLQPHQTENFDHYAERAQKVLDQPRVTPDAFFQIDTENTAFLDVYVPTTQETHEVQVREGEEFFGYRLNRIMNNNSGIVIEYLPTGEELEIPYEP